MAHPQNTPRGLHSKWRYSVPVGMGIMAEDYSTTTDLLTASASGLKVAAGVALSGQTTYITQSASATIFPTGITLSAASGIITQNSTSGVIFPVRICPTTGGKTIASNSTGFVLGAVTSAPATRSAAKVAQLLSSSKSYLMINSTGTTWLYLNVTSVAPY